MCRRTTTAAATASSSGTTPTTSPAQQLSTSIRHIRQSIAPGAAKASQFSGTRDSDETLSISSSVFRRDEPDKAGGHDGNGKSSAGGGSAASALSEEKLRRDARLDVQHRLRLMPAALWGKRAKHADAAYASVGEKETETAMITEQQQQQRVFLATGSVARTKNSQGQTKRHLDSSGGVGEGGRREKENNHAITVALSSSFGHHDDYGGFVLPVGAKFAEAASLKRPAVTASVPLRWQSRVVAQSSLRDSLDGSATRGSPSMGRRIAKTRCRAHQRLKKKRYDTRKIQKRVL